MEFFHYHPDKALPGQGDHTLDLNASPKKTANIYAHDRLHIEGNVIPPAWLGGKVDEARWNSSVKSRDPEAVHLPEYKAWHLHGQKITDNAAYNWDFMKQSKNSPPPKYVSRGPPMNYTSPNVGFKI